MPPLRLGVFGGTFSPPHVAHLAVAEAAREQGRLDRVLWVPAAVSPFKQGEATPAPEHRLEMTRLATADHPTFEVSDVEVARRGVSYTVDTLAALADAHPGAELFLILGGDSLASFPRWREPERILELARLLVYHRPGDGVTSLPEGLAARTTFVEAPRIELASTEVRALIGAGRSARYLVPEPVRAYIRAHGLYRGEGT